MGFGADVDHEAEKAKQAEIQAEVEAAEAPVEEPSVDEEVPVDPSQAPVEVPVEEEPLVTVKATNPDLSSAAVAGYPFDFTDSDTVEDVPASIAALFEDSPNVEVVEAAV